MLEMAALAGIGSLAGCGGIDAQNSPIEETFEPEPQIDEPDPQLESPYEPEIKVVTATPSHALFELELTSNRVDGYAEIGHFQVATGNMEDAYIRRVTPLPVIRDNEPIWMNFGRKIAVLAGDVTIDQVPYSNLKKFLRLYEEQQFQEQTQYVNKTNLFVGKTKSLPERMVSNKARFLIHLRTSSADAMISEWKPNLGFFYRPEDQQGPTAQFATTPFRIKTSNHCVMGKQESDEKDNQESLAAPFTQTFDSGLNGWTIGLHEDAGDRVTKGDGEWTEEYGGSVRLHVDGGPNHIGVWKAAEAMPEGTEIQGRYETNTLAGKPGGPRLTIHPPDNDHFTVDFDQGGEGETDGILRGTLPQDVPDETEVEFRLGVWPGDIEVFVTEMSATPP